MYAAGILPICWVDPHTPLFLVGSDIRDNLLSDFGGRSEKVDKDRKTTTACRECHEETHGVLGGMKELQFRMKNSRDVLLLRSTTQNNLDYYMYILEVPYIPGLRSTFRKVVKYIQHANFQKVFVEKTDLMYVSWDKLKNLKKRPGFEHTLNLHRATFEILARSTAFNWRENVPPPPVLRPNKN